MRFNLGQGLGPFRWTSLGRDVLAGAMLASMNIPQLLGYARIASMPAVSGLYTALLPPVLFALFGASRHLVVAADSGTATIFAGSLATMTTPSSAQYIALAGGVALLTAGLLLLARVFKLGFLADFLSRTVLVGFLTGVGVQVGIAMLGDMFGISSPSGSTPARVELLIENASQMRATTLALSVGVVVLILFFKRVLPRLPIAFFAVIASIWASDVFDFAGHGIAIMGPTAGGLPSLQLPLPTWHEALTLLPVAVSCFVVILAQSSATGRVFADRYDEQLDEDADILGLAAANAAAAVTGAFVVNGSPTQTAMADLAGARSQYAQLTFAAVVAIVLLFLSGWLEYLPRAVLASVVFTIAIGLLDLKSLREIRRESPGEFALAVFTAGAVVVVGVENGIVLAVAISLMRHVRHSYHPHTVILAPGPDGQWQPRTATPGMQTAPGLIVYRFGADLFFANDHFFVDEVRRLIDAAPTRVHRFIVDAGAITDLDFSASRTLKNLCDALTGQGIDFVFARVSAYLRADMDRHGISPAIGEGRIFSTLHEALGEPAHPPPI